MKTAELLCLEELSVQSGQNYIFSELHLLRECLINNKFKETVSVLSKKTTNIFSASHIANKLFILKQRSRTLCYIKLERQNSYFTDFVNDK